MKQKKLWAAALAAVLCFAGLLAGCKNRDEILRDVNELHLMTSTVSSFISIVDDHERKEEVLDFFNNVDLAWHEKNSQGYEEVEIMTDDYDLMRALVIMVLPNEGKSFDLHIYPNGAVKSYLEEGCYFADAGAVDYEGLKSVVERIEREEREKLQQDVK